MKRKRRKFSSAFKAKVAIEAIKERETLSELATRHEVHANQISKWKKEFLAHSEQAFNSSDESEIKEEDMDKLYRKIGKLEVENEFLKKSLWKTGL